MKITRLTTSNIKRLSAVSITPDGNLITIGGENGAGKSSVLDSIAYALGGSSLIPPEPIRTGENEAIVTVELDDITVVRKFTRVAPKCICSTPRAEGQAHEEPCTKQESTVRSSLVVKSKDGTANYSSPQAMLDKLMGKLTFDPLAFAHDSAANQEKTLRALVNLDTSDLDSAHLSVYGVRAGLNKQINALDVRIKAMAFHSDAPEAEQPLSEVSQSILEAEHKRQAADVADRALSAAQTNTEKIKSSLKIHEEELARLTKLVEQEGQAHATALIIQSQAQTNANETKALVPDVKAIRQRLDEIELMNRKVRENNVIKGHQEELKAATVQAFQLTQDLANLSDEKEKRLANVKFPIPGLGFGTNGVIFNNLPLEQASHADQLRISVAIGLALNQKVKVLLVRDGSLLTSKSLAAMAAQAAEADAQIWLEKATETKEGVQVFIEDGAVAN